MSKRVKEKGNTGTKGSVNQKSGKNEKRAGGKKSRRKKAGSVKDMTHKRGKDF